MLQDTVKFMQYKSFIKNRQIKRETFSQGKKHSVESILMKWRPSSVSFLSANHRENHYIKVEILITANHKEKKSFFIGGNIDHSCVNSRVSDRPLAPPPLPLVPVSSVCGFAAVGAAVLGLWLHSPLRRLFKVGYPPWPRSVRGWVQPDPPLKTPSFFCVFQQL